MGDSLRKSLYNHRMGLKKKLLSLGLTVPLLISASPSKGNAKECNGVIIKYSYYKKINGEIHKIFAYKCIPYEVWESIQIQEQSNNSNLYKQKQQKEFTPPELPYCRIKYYDSNSVIIDFWQKNGKKREIHYLVTNITEGMYSAGITFEHSSNGKDYGAWKLNGAERTYLTDVCLYRTVKKILKR